MFGALIIREPNDPHADLYDYDLLEHVIHVQDWMHELAINRYTGLYHGSATDVPNSIIINGEKLQ